VATVVQPLSCSVDEDHSHGVHGGEGDSGDQLNKYARTALLVGGMALPVVLSWIVGDDH
jgi:zinc transporter 9